MRKEITEEAINYFSKKKWKCLICNEDINEDEMCKCMRDYKRINRKQEDGE